MSEGNGSRKTWRTEIAIGPGGLETCLNNLEAGGYDVREIFPVGHAQTSSTLGPTADGKISPVFMIVARVPLESFGE